MSIFKDCDVRGVYGAELRDTDGYQIGRALATLTNGGRFFVGGDVRVSTPELKAALIRGLCESGAEVLDLGTVATPVLYFALHQTPGASGCMVTASHNPPRYNGIKFMLDGATVTRETMDALAAVVASGAYRAGAGTVSAYDMDAAYLQSMEARFGRGHKLRVVLDAGNGCMGRYAPEAFRRAGYDVRTLFCEPDGRFPNRTPNPAEYEQLTALHDAVLRERADFGVAFDGDGDRAVFVDDTGCALWSERSLALMIRYLLKDAPAPVVYDQKSSSVVADAIRAMGGTPVLERSGHTFIKRRFLALNAPIAGEVSGHFFFGALGYDDALYAALLMGEIVERAGVSLSALVAPIVCPPITPDIRIACPYAEQDAALARFAEIGADGEISRLDGVRITSPDGWVLARKSVTAEQLTVRAEAKDEASLRRLREKFGF